MIEFPHINVVRAAINSRMYQTAVMFAYVDIDHEHIQNEWSITTGWHESPDKAVLVKAVKVDNYDTHYILLVISERIYEEALTESEQKIHRIALQVDRPLSINSSLVENIGRSYKSILNGYQHEIASLKYLSETVNDVLLECCARILREINDNLPLIDKFSVTDCLRQLDEYMTGNNYTGIDSLFNTAPWNDLKNYLPEYADNYLVIKSLCDSADRALRLLRDHQNAYYQLPLENIFNKNYIATHKAKGLNDALKEFLMTVTRYYPDMSYAYFKLVAWTAHP